jgi:hypothetical protein
MIQTSVSGIHSGFDLAACDSRSSRGGEWANVASNWLRWQLEGDKQAAKMFVG